MLDEEHDQLDPVGNDSNSYILGRIKKHNVVIDFPGSGTLSGAAQTVNNLIRTYRKIRFGLMVGIGGGAPESPNAEDRTKIFVLETSW